MGVQVLLGWQLPFTQACPDAHGFEGSHWGQAPLVHATQAPFAVQV